MTGWEIPEVKGHFRSMGDFTLPGWMTGSFASVCCCATCDRAQTAANHSQGPKASHKIATKVGYELNMGDPMTPWFLRLYHPFPNIDNCQLLEGTSHDGQIWRCPKMEAAVPLMIIDLSRISYDFIHPFGGAPIVGNPPYSQVPHTIRFKNRKQG